MWNFKGTLWNSTQNILPKHWKIWILYNIEILRALGFKSSYAFLKRPPGLTDVVPSEPRLNIKTVVYPCRASHYEYKMVVRLVFIMGIPILVRWYLYIKTPPAGFALQVDSYYIVTVIWLNILPCKPPEWMHIYPPKLCLWVKHKTQNPPVYVHICFVWTYLKLRKCYI